MEKIHLEAGLPILVELSGRLPFDTHVIGFETGSYIIVKQVNSRSDSDISVNSLCSARLIHDGVIYSFSTEVQAALTSPAPLVFLKYPSRIDVVQLRRDRRYSVNLPAVFQNNTQKYLIKVSSVTDISMKGCRISIMESAKHPPIRIGDSCKVSFIVMHKYFEAFCIVKNIYEGSDAAHVGLEFTEIKELCRELLEGMINILETQGGASSEPDAT
jgi:c-di-GMP-binding flagellar brake protein YcgR